MTDSDDRRLRSVANKSATPGDLDPGKDGDPGGGDATGASDDALDKAERRARRRRRGVYLLPNLITTGALFSGFYAIVAGMNGNFIAAGIAVYAAFFLDTLDGRIARMTRSESAFGAEYDSLSDMVAFGVAPSLVAFSWALSSLGQIGWVVSFVYMACAALRLARFNTAPDNTSFTGLASPSAAAIVASAVWVWHESLGGATPGTFEAASIAVITAAAGLLMVSNFNYFSPKTLPLKGRVPFVSMVGVVLAFAILLLDPPRVLLTLFALYALSGPVVYVYRLFRPGPALPVDDEPS